MGNDVINEYLSKINDLEIELVDANCVDKLRKYKLYRELLRRTASENFHSFNKYLELDEDWNSSMGKFYGKRKECLKEMFNSLNEMETEDKYDVLIISCPPRVRQNYGGY